MATEKDISYYFNKFKYGVNNYQDLMRFKIRSILLVSTFYDAFIFKQDGMFSEQLFSEYEQMDLSQLPRITNVPTGKEALKLLEEREFDLVITMMRIGEVSPYELSKQIKSANPDIPVLLLLNNESDIDLVNRNINNMGFIDDVFLWNGDSALFLAMIKYVEDLSNVERDTDTGLVHVILIVEDSVRYYSRFLPLLYKEIISQTDRLAAAELSSENKRRRRRARPKVLLVHSYNDAVDVIEKYKESLISVISDVKYPKDDELDETAGLQLMEMLNKKEMFLAKLLQSTDIDYSMHAYDLDAKFLHKNSQTLLLDLRKFIKMNLGFGDLIFRNKNDVEVARASNLLEFETLLSKVPSESILYHAQRNHFSAWLVAHGEIQVARRIRPINFDRFSKPETLRRYLRMVFKDIRTKRNRGEVIEFDKLNIDPEGQIIRLRDGSLGGKGRGLAFLNSLIFSLDLNKEYRNIKIKMPKTFIIGTKEFDEFISNNNIKQAIMELDVDKKAVLQNWHEFEDVVSLLQTVTADDNEICEIFRKGVISQALDQKLRMMLEVNKEPLAIRSSGLLEDSQSQPFAGVYKTFMLPNNEADFEIRLSKLKEAIKYVFASVFLLGARNYIKNINYKLEEEKMAVIIQNIVGTKFDDLFYPHISGVAQSYNFFPTAKLKGTDGIATIAAGMGKAVVEGESNFIFCPKYPKHSIVSEDDVIKNTQKSIYALELHSQKQSLFENEGLVKERIRKIKTNGSFDHLVSIWDIDNERLNPGLKGKGPVIVNFSNIIKHDHIQLASILNRLLDICKQAMGVPVEIEFALKINEKTKEHTFYLLQIRPLNVLLESTDIDLDNLNKDNLILYSERSMGNGNFDSIKDIIIFDPANFDNTQTIEMQEEIEQFNQKMLECRQQYILIGPGRWGTRDRFLGIPVKWSQISNAKAIIEVGIKDFQVDASQGTHFFHNLMSMNVGYFTIPYNDETDFLDIDWILSQKVTERKKYFIHYSFNDPLVIKIDGKKQMAVILKKQI